MVNNLFLVTLTSVAALGAFFGFGLAIAARVFHVEVDPRVEQIEDLLPGANCGACGFTGCSNFALSVVEGEVEVSGCPVGGSEIAEKIAEIMGLETGVETERRIACICCQGDRERAGERSNYEGIRSCTGAELVEGGFKACPHGCLGLGDCVRACPFDAIDLDERGLPVVDTGLCTACGKCTEACPRELIALVGEDSKVHIRCRSTDKAKRVRSVCEIGCLGCGLCVKECPFDAIELDNNLAVIDYEECKSCGLCAEKCPTGAIENGKEK